MTLKAVWIVCLVAAALVVITSAWISAFYLRLGGARGRRRRILATSTTFWIGIYGVAIGYCGFQARYSSIGLLLVAIALFLLSLLLQWGAVAAHGKNRPAFAFVEQPPESFVRTGPYRWVRHPLYSAYLLALAAGPLAAHGLWPHNLWLLVSIPWLGSFYYAAAAAEERSFRDTPFADEYAAYQAATGMFLPKLRPLGCCCSPGSPDGGQPEADGVEGGPT